MTIQLIIRLLTTTAMKWWDDNPWRLSAALSYYALFSLAPLLTLAVAVAAVVVDETVVQGELLRQLQELIGEKGTNAMTHMLHSAGHPVEGTVATLISFITLFIVSMGMFSELQDALNLIWRIPSRPRSSALWGLLRTRLFSFLLVIGTGFLLVAALTLNIVMAAAGKFIDRQMPDPQVIMTMINIMGSPVVMAVLFALMFKILPEGHIAWQDVWIGAIATAALFTLGRWAIGLYLGGPAMTSMYGAASSLMAILVWVYYSALIFFLGAEFTYVYAHQYGSRRPANPQ
ncbi:MAG TPA: YihY/virulence factor BrkB family protein [Candidatus Paceibacterota bacterium]